MNWKVVQNCVAANDNADGECRACGAADKHEARRDVARQERERALSGREGPRRFVSVSLDLPEALQGPNATCPQAFSAIELRLLEFERIVNERLIPLAREGNSREVEQLLGGALFAMELDELSILRDAVLDDDDLCSLFRASHLALEELQRVNGNEAALDAFELALSEARYIARFSCVSKADWPKLSNMSAWLEELRDESRKFARAVRESIGLYIDAVSRPEPSFNAIALAMTSRLSSFASNGVRSVRGTLSKRAGAKPKGLRAYVEAELVRMLVSFVPPVFAKNVDAANW